MPQNDREIIGIRGHPCAYQFAVDLLYGSLIWFVLSSKLISGQVAIDIFLRMLCR
jgi:hypothetical protein